MCSASDSDGFVAPDGASVSVTVESGANVAGQTS